jgi:hypothetical protein
VKKTLTLGIGSYQIANFLKISIGYSMPETCPCLQAFELGLSFPVDNEITFIWCIWLRRESRLCHVLLPNFSNLQLKTLFVGEDVAVTNLRNKSVNI